jgi:hypothetical protein
VQIREQRVLGAHQVDLGRLRLFDLDDQLAALENRFGVGARTAPSAANDSSLVVAPGPRPAAP